MEEEAKIVYTPSHLHIPPDNQVFPLDLNHDGRNDFSFDNASFQCHGTCGGGIGVSPLRKGNEVWGQHYFASALPPGVRIGGRGHSNFSQRAGYMADFNTYDGVYHFKGQWANDGKGVKNRYLGLKFQVNGKTHFGWARLNVAFKPHLGFFAVLTGYAYETIANKPIIAGKTKGPDDASVGESNTVLTVPTPEPATLGVLALGSPRMSIWRREESAVAAR